MPAIVGPVAITSVGGGVVNFGDTFYISPKGASKTATGSGALNTGNFVITNNGLSATNTLDPDFSDQDIVANK
ncbi:putative spore germination protein GerPF [Bacillus sp. THAF10]|uniref:spore germination protein n=1 Tax=Bacillus sp. THAF10 TaxID=2587848 RepID=UPI0012686B5C|nr:spore germination protein [Bacillus sp. THAF10]QFT88311.1 putative spore germination protein GerPF [Bacillus sp. THAF10]